MLQVRTPENPEMSEKNEDSQKLSITDGRCESVKHRNKIAYK